MKRTLLSALAFAMISMVAQAENTAKPATAPETAKPAAAKACNPACEKDHTCVDGKCVKETKKEATKK
jgi:Na+-transporting methylmalonyl-CoA/oxaloacetate decarboxylase gamma subunit